jgi:enterochelin esterase family protein
MAQAQAQVDAVAAQGKAFHDKVHLLWFGVGTTEANFCNRTQEVRAQLEKAGIPSGYYESLGTAHEFQTWRRCLREFAPLLFQTAVSPTKKK